MVSKALLSLATMAWGIHNTGESQRINIDHFTSGYVMGVKGEDIRLPAPAAHSSKVIVAVLDTGVDANHPALKDVLAGKGFNFVNNNEETADTHGHGTHIAGVIATQVTKNALILPVKVVQTGPNAPIRPQEVEAGAGTALTENVAKGIKYAVENGAKVINLSLAWPVSIRSKTMDEAMALAEQKEVLVIGSAANDSTSANLYPCIYSNAICVGAHGPDGALTYFSNYGSMVDILAPGIAILSTWPMNKAPVTFAGQIGYEFRNGTSMAAPFVAGAAVEMLSRGYSASEVKTRLLLGARTTQATNLYTTSVVGKFAPDQKKERKFSRFGNLDVTGALAVSPQSFVMPVKKARTEIVWNGTDASATAQVQWKNHWKAATNVKITLNGQSFSANALAENETLTTPVTIPLNASTESTFDRFATVETDEINGAHTVRTVPVSFEVTRLITPQTAPQNAIRYTFQTIRPRDYTSIRSVVNADGSVEREFYLIRKNEMVLTRKGVEMGRFTVTGLDKPLEATINVLYRIDEDHYSLVFPAQAKGEARPSFIVKFFNNKLQLQSEIKIGTDVTVLPQSFVWKKSNSGNSLLWISVGYTPAAEKPAYDPWNPNATDPKTPKIYYTEGKDLHTIVLKNDEMPILVLPHGDVLIVKGDGYYARYFILSVDLTQKEKIAQKKEISLFSYRMLLGLDGSNRVWNLKGSTPDSVLMVGPSSPGNLRATTINEPNATQGIDSILRREGTLDSLMVVSAAFQDLDQQYYFAQTHFDMKFYRSKSPSTHSLSLNRYSYIPSMNFLRNFFPVVAKDASGNGIPAVYIPASVANANISEIIFGNPKTGEIFKPAAYHLAVGPGCMAPDDLVPATQTDTAKQIFVCGNEVIMVPIVAPIQ